MKICQVSIIKAVWPTKHHSIPHILYYSFIYWQAESLFCSHYVFSAKRESQRKALPCQLWQNTHLSVCVQCGYVVFLSAHWWASPLQCLFIYLETEKIIKELRLFKHRRDNYVSLGDAAKTSVRNEELHSTVETPQEHISTIPHENRQENLQESLRRETAQPLLEFLGRGDSESVRDISLIEQLEPNSPCGSPRRTLAICCLLFPFSCSFRLGPEHWVRFVLRSGSGGRELRYHANSHGICSWQLCANKQ